MTINSSLANHLLVAMPSVSDSTFEHAVVYICEHHSAGTVGLIINRPLQFPLQVVFEQLQIANAPLEQNKKPLLFGGPLQTERGFVIHRPWKIWNSSLELEKHVIVTTSSDIIRAMANEHAPKDILVTLGYTGWSAKQLEEELMKNIWLVCPSTPEILYEVPFAERWNYAGKSIGINMNQLSTLVGHA